MNIYRNFYVLAIEKINDFGNYFTNLKLIYSKQNAMGTNTGCG